MASGYWARILAGVILTMFCSTVFSGADPDPDPTAGVSRGSPLGGFAGRYRGSFSGDDTGTWILTVAADGTVTGASTSDTYGSERISGSLSSSGRFTISGVAGTTVFSGRFSQSGAISGNWRDEEGSSGTFTGKRVVSPTSKGDVPGGLKISGEDIVAIGGEFTPNADAATVGDPTAISGKVSISWNQYLVSTSPAGVESRTIYLLFNEVDGRVRSVGYLRSLVTGLAGGLYSYNLDCGEIPRACAYIRVDIARRQVIFNNTTLAADGDTDNKAMGSIVLNGTLNW